MTPRPVLAELCSTPAVRRQLCALPSVAAMLLALGASALAHAQPATAQGQPVQDQPAVGQPAAAAPQGEALRAVIIDVGGKVQWRASETEAWRNAAVNDILLPGAEVRTGTRSHAALRIGRNATALVDAGTRFQIPVAVQDGDVLRTTVAVKQGRADFKVDKVGLANDFKVVTPSTTLAVRGTGFAVASGQLKQVEVLGARRNAINAIELKYALTSTTVQMSGGASSSSAVQQPAHSAMVSTASPATAGALPATSAAETVTEAAVGPSPANAGSPASNQQSNNASAKSQNSVANVTDPKTDGSGIVAAINRALVQQGADAVAEADRAVVAARAEVDERIRQLLADLDEEELLQANQDALAALRALAVARRDAARDALARHEGARAAASAAEASATARRNAFHARDLELVSHLGVFDADRTAALGALASIRSFIDDERAGGGSEDAGDRVLADAEEATERLASMGASLSSGMEALLAMDEHVEAVNAIIAGLDAGARVQASGAIADYQRALQHLALAVTVGDDAEAIARATRDTVAALEALVASLAESRPSPALLAHAESAAALLRSASADLDRAVLVRNAVRAARNSAANDPRARSFGQVEQAYGRIVQLRIGMVGRWLAAAGAVDLRDARLASALGEAQSTFADLAGLASDTTAARLAQAQAAVAAAGEAEAQALAARDVDEASAVADANAALASAQARGADAAVARAAAGLERAGVEEAGALAGTALGAASDATSEAARVTAIGNARNALDAMHAALVALVGHEASVRGAVDGSPTSPELEALLARAEAALDRMMAARNAASGAAVGADEAAEDARSIAVAVASLLDLAEGLESLYSSSYGFSAAAVRAGESETSADAAGAEAARDAARALRDAVAAIHDEAIAGDRVPALVAQVRAALDANALVAAAAYADLAAGEAAFLQRGSEAGSAYGSLASAAAARAGSAASDAVNAEADAAAAIAAHAAALVGADAAVASAQGSRESADAAIAGIGVALADFSERGSAASAALDALEQLAAQIGQGASAALGEGGAPIDEARQQVAAAVTALEAMADAFEDADGLRQQLAVDRAAIDALVASLDSGERASAAAAIMAYDAAVARLSSLAAAGADASSVAAAAAGAASRLRDLVGVLGQLRPSDGQLALAQQVADRLSAIAGSMAAADSARAAIDGLGSQAAGLAAGARLGEVEAAYAGLVVMQASVLASFTGAESSVGAADAALGAAVGRTETVFDALSLAAQGAADVRATEAAAFADAAAAAHADALAGRAASQSAVDDAEALHARALARSADADAAASGATVARAALDAHGTSVMQALSGLSGLQTHSFNLGTFTLGSGDFVTRTSGPLGGPITGFTISFGFSGTPLTWASDAALGINGLQWGGYNQFTLPGQAFQGNWSFYGPESWASATYSDTVSGISIPTANGVTLLFGNAWSTWQQASATYSNVQIDLRTAGPGGYSRDLAQAHLASIGAAADAMESMRASLDSLAGHRDTLRDLADRSAWDAESAALAARAVAAREAVQDALVAATAAASGAGVSADDLADLADAMQAFASVAAQLEARFGADRGFSAANVAAGAQHVAGLVAQASQSAAAADALRQLVAALDADAAADVRVAAVLAQVAASLNGSDAHVSQRFSAADAQLASGAAAFVTQATVATGAFADYGLSARLAAGTAADGADAAAGTAEPLRQMVVLRDAADARSSDVAGGTADFGLGQSEFAAARALADGGIAALPGQAAGIGGMQEAAEVKAALDRMEAALLGSIGMEASASRVSTALGDTARYEALGALAAQATAAIDDILAARDATAAFAGSAQDAAGAAGGASAAAQRIVAICTDLEQRFGLSGDLIRAAAQLASDRSSAAASDRDRAVRARDLVADLALLASASQINQLAQQIGATIAATDASAAGLTAAQSAALAEARAQYAASNHAGAVAFGGLTGNRRDQSLLVEASGTAAYGQLEGLVGRFDTAVAGLDAVEADAGLALGRATDAADSAEGARSLAIVHRDGAEQSYGLTLGSLAADDVSAAVHHRNDAAQSASASEGEAARASGFHGDAVTARNDIISLDADMAARIAQFTSASADQADSGAFALALGAHRDAVAIDATLAGTLSQQAAYFDGIAQVLAGRAGGDLQGVLSDSSAALIEAQRVAGQLATLSGQATAMANGASTNAGRLFGRSLGSYVADAQVQVDRAASAAVDAATAALQARGFADGAHTAVQQHNQGQGGGGQ